jgi:tetratricopeptide (TPR) repeat protein
MHRAWLPFLLLLLVAIGATVPSRGLAQASQDAEARMLFQAGELAFADGRFESALESFRRSYELSHRPELLYNIGTAADRLRRDAEAITAFEQFLAARPETPNRHEIEGRLAVLRRATAASSAGSTTTTTTATDTASQTVTGITETTPTSTASSRATVSTTSATTSSTASTSDGGPGVVPWIVVGIGGAAAITGAILIGLAAADVASVEGAAQGTAWADVSGAYDRSEPMSIAGGVLLGVGVAAAAAGVVWAVAGGSSGSSTEVAVGPGSVAVRGSF